MRLLILFCCTGIALGPFDAYGLSKSFASPGHISEQQGDYETSSNDRWVNLFNTNIQHIDSIYVPNAILLSPNGTIYDTPEERKDFYTRLKSSVGNIKSVTTINRAELTPDHSYEIGSFITSGNVKYKHLIIWKKVKGVLLRELEIISESKGETDIASVNLARQQWMDWCNRHKVNELVSNLYTENAMYYNNSRALSGTGNITKEYRYMNNPTYHLILTPIILEPVNENLAFEIGQCSGSYQGKYTLAWGRSKGVWKVLFDSN